ncbi:MAG TPA: nuclear transport factor 2 family protein [Novosphingobium sp.]|jgi:hypothetical protein|nr:nuclear transport factor 2 family protein [Novosphingobium sp.]
MTPDQENLARMAIRHTQSIYNNCGDRGQVEEMVATFTPDGVMQTNFGVYEGRDGILAFVRSVVARNGDADMAGSRHNLTTSRIEFESDTVALGWTYFFVSRRGVTLEDGIYIDRYEKLGDRWLIAHRRVKSLWFLNPPES